MSKPPPKIGQVIFRMFGGSSDIAALMRIRAEIQVHPEWGWMPTADQFQVGANGDDPQPCRDVLIADVDGEAIGFTWLTRWIETPDTRVYLNRGWVLPKWRRHGIGRAMLRWQEAHSRELMACDAKHAKFALAANADEWQPSVRALIESEGYRVAFTSVDMELAPLQLVEEIRLPPGFTPREVNGGDVDSVFAFVKPMLWDADVRYAKSAICDLSLWAVAWDGSEIAGVVISEIENGVGRTPWVAVGKEYRRRGLARSLLGDSLLKMKNRGAQRAEISTVVENPHGPMHLYEAMGYRVVRRMPRYRKAVI